MSAAAPFLKKRRFGRFLHFIKTAPCASNSFTRLIQGKAFAIYENISPPTQLLFFAPEYSCLLSNTHFPSQILTFVSPFVFVFASQFCTKILYLCCAFHTTAGDFLQESSRENKKGREASSFQEGCFSALIWAQKEQMIVRSASGELHVIHSFPTARSALSSFFLDLQRFPVDLSLA